MSAGCVPDFVEQLWEGEAPAAQGKSEKDVPTLSIFLPEAGCVGAGVIIVPGGAYQHVALEKEGYTPARWFNSLGIAAFVLNYRVNNNSGTGYEHPVPLIDARRAMRVVRSRAKEFGIEDGNLGLMGFSAGGHLAATVATSFEDTVGDDVDSLAPLATRPDFLMLVYPVITMLDPYMHEGSRRNLLGAGATEEMLNRWSAENAVTERTPPTFLVHGGEDQSVPPENSVEFYRALRRAGVPAEMHLYQGGPHGFGMLPGHGPASTWPGRLEDWLANNINISITKE